MADSDSAGSPNEGRARKRTRTISNLTEEQIQHKRSIDRKAQRAFRQRTKDCISSLEEQIAQLQNTTSEREAGFQRELSALRGNNKRLLQCLEHIVEFASATARRLRDDTDTGDDSESQIEGQRLEPALLVDTSEDPASHDISVAAPVDDVPHMQSPIETESHSAGPIAPVLSDHTRLPFDSQVNPPSRTPQPASIQSDHRDRSRRRESMAGEAISYVSEGGESSYRLNPIIPEKRHEGYPSPTRSYPLRRDTLDMTDSSPQEYHIAHAPNGEHRADTMLTLLSPSSTATVDTRYNHRSSSLPSHVSTVLPSHVSPTCPLDQILHDFLNSRRNMITNGVPLDAVIGPAKPTVKSLLNPELTGSVHALSRVMSEVLSTFPYVAQPEKLAFFYLMCQTMRWQISPSRENYTAMPTWLRPTVTQITVRHAAWIDNIPWPGVRDLLIENPDDHPFQIFSQYYSQNVSVNWHFDNLDAISEADNEVILHSIFEKHIRNLKNWTVTTDFQRRFPAMTPAIYSSD